eukprot:scaffold64326_cov59-Phaeocystis_antarctica.AAC.6
MARELLKRGANVDVRGSGGETAWSKCLPWQRPSLAPAPPQGAPGGTVGSSAPSERGRPSERPQSSEFIRAYTRQTDQDSPTSNSWRAASERPATASGARDSRLRDSRPPFHRLWPFRRDRAHDGCCGRCAPLRPAPPAGALGQP